MGANRIGMIQGSPEWHTARLGKLTASRMADALARTKTGWGAGRANLLAELLVERLTGEPSDRYVSPAMQWGIDNESLAADTYAFRTDADLTVAGFVDHPSIAMSGASPDRLVGADGLLEVKCPLTATHLDTVLSGAIPARYLTQMGWQLACTGRAWCDFVSFDPRLPGGMRLFIRRVRREELHVPELEREARVFLGELDAKMARLDEACARAA
jgi:putative phage-type endonuclease